MKNYLILICSILIFSQNALSQNKEIRLIGGGGLSFIGTGDLSGYTYLNQVDIQLNNRVFLSPGIQINNHSSSRFVTSQVAFNFVNSGINLFTTINYSIINKSRHRIAIGAGPVVSFQRSSYPNQVGMNRSNSGEEIIFVQYGKLHTTSLGYNITPSYYYQTSKRLILGAKLIFQNDTNGDVIHSGLVFAGIRL